MTAVMEARNALAGLDPAHVSGLLTTTRIPDAPIELEKLRALMAAEGLDTSGLPAKRSRVHDFSLACRAVESKRGRVRKGERVTVGEAVANASESVYQITREEVDEDNRVIHHPKAMRMVYDKSAAGDPIRVEPLDPTHYEALKHLEHEVRLRFSALNGTLPGPKVRELVRDQFKAMNATRWSSGSSVWFVPKEHNDRLHALERMLKAAYPDSVEFTTAPLPNSEGVRAIVEDKVGEHAHADAARLMAEIATKLSDGADVRLDTFQRTKARADELRTYGERMEKMLDGEVTAVREAMRLVDQQLMEMWGRVKS